MSDISEEVAAAPIHEFQLTHRIRPPGGGPGWSQTQTGWSNAADTRAALEDLVTLHGLDWHELVGAAAERAAAATAAALSPPPAPDAGDGSAAVSEPGGM